MWRILTVTRRCLVAGEHLEFGGTPVGCASVLSLEREGTTRLSRVVTDLRKRRT